MHIIFRANPPDYQERIKSGTHGPPAPVPAQMPLAEATAGPWVGRQAALLYGVLVRHYLGLSKTKFLGQSPLNALYTSASN